MTGIPSPELAAPTSPPMIAEAATVEVVSSGCSHLAVWGLLHLACSVNGVAVWMARGSTTGPISQSAATTGRLVTTATLNLIHNDLRLSMRKRAGAVANTA